MTFFRTTLCLLDLNYDINSQNSHMSIEVFSFQVQCLLYALIIDQVLGLRDLLQR